MNILTAREISERKVTHPCRFSSGAGQGVTVLLQRDVTGRLTGWCLRCGAAWREETSSAERPPGSGGGGGAGV